MSTKPTVRMEDTRSSQTAELARINRGFATSKASMERMLEETETEGITANLDEIVSEWKSRTRNLRELLKPAKHASQSKTGPVELTQTLTNAEQREVDLIVNSLKQDIRVIHQHIFTEREMGGKPLEENSVDDTYNREQWADWRERVNDIEQQLSQNKKPVTVGYLTRLIELRNVLYDQMIQHSIEKKDDLDHDLGFVNGNGHFNVAPVAGHQISSDGTDQLVFPSNATTSLLRLVRQDRELIEWVSGLKPSFAGIQGAASSQQLKNQNAELQRDKKRLREQLEKHENEIKAMQTETAELAAAGGGKMRILNKTRAEKEELRKELKQEKMVAADINRTNADLTRENARNADTVKQLTIERNDIRRKFETEKRTNRARLEDLEASREEMYHALGQMQEHMDLTQALAKKYGGMVENLQRALAKRENQQKDRFAMLDSARQDTAKLLQRLAHSERIARAAMLSAQKSQEESREARKTTSEIIRAATEAKQKARMDVEHVNRELQDSREETGEREEDIRKLEAIRTQQDGTIKSLQKRLDAGSEKVAEMDQVRFELKKAQAQVAELNAKNKDLQDQIYEMRLLVDTSTVDGNASLDASIAGDGNASFATPSKEENDNDANSTADTFSLPSPRKVEVDSDANSMADSFSLSSQRKIENDNEPDVDEDVLSLATPAEQNIDAEAAEQED